MKNIILSIYKFNFPFFSKQVDEIIFLSISNDLEKLFLYSDIFISKKRTKNEKFIKDIFILKDFYVDFKFYKKNEFYFIPKLEFNLYRIGVKGKEKINFILKNILENFISIGKNSFIFNFYDNEKKYDFLSEILTLSILKKSFKKYNYAYLNEFLKNTNKEYLEEFLLNNKIIRNSFYYLIFLCYINYINILRINFSKKELKKILEQKKNNKYFEYLLLQKTRLNIVEENMIKNFFLYKSMLDKIFKKIS